MWGLIAPNDSSDVFAIPIILIVSFICFWFILRLFRYRRSGITQLLSILFTFILAPFNPIAIVIAIVPFILGFICGRSTRVPSDVTDRFSPRIKCSDIGYAKLVERHEYLISNLAIQEQMLSPYLSVHSKLSLLFPSGFGIYRHSRSLAMVTSLGYLTIWGSANEGYSDLYGLLFFLSLPFGTAMGFLWKYLKGHPYGQFA
jgi:hypothetical protein